jgi:hypothetical protein
VRFGIAVTIVGGLATVVALAAFVRPSDKPRPTEARAESASKPQSPGVPVESTATTVATRFLEPAAPRASLSDVGRRSFRLVPTRTVTPARVSRTGASNPCSASIAEVEARGLYPAPGFAVTCPGNALGHEGMTCLNISGICPGRAEIAISLAEPFVVANEFENSRIFAHISVRCAVIDCGGTAYGF